MIIIIIVVLAILAIAGSVVVVVLCYRMPSKTEDKETKKKKSVQIYKDAPTPSTALSTTNSTISQAKTNSTVPVVSQHKKNETQRFFYRITR